MAISTTLPNFLQPSQGKDLYSGNYIDFQASGFQQWGQQFLPDVYEKEVEIYGNRTISSFLRMVSAEMPSTSDQIIWTEQGRLHARFTGLVPQTSATLPTAAVPTATASIAIAAVTAGTPIHFGLRAQTQPTGSTTTVGNGIGQISFRVGQTVMIGREGGTAGKTQGATIKGVVTATSTFGFSVSPYQSLASFGGGTTDTYTALAYGSEFAKGTGNFTDKLDPSYTTYNNSPIIMKEHYSINGSDTSQIGWVEVTSENGANGYLWYVKSEHENRLRWEDYLEMALVEGVENDGTTNNLQSFRSDFGGGTAASSTAKGTQGFFDALVDRGNLYNDLSGDLNTAGTTTDSGRTALAASFDQILAQLDKQGSIEENMLYVNRPLALAFDNFLAVQNNYGGTAGVSWGVFNNAQDMAINLGFSGFRRGSYDFYKTDWKYLNDFSTRGAFGDVEGVMIPAGTSTVYDQNLGKNIKRPFLHVRYRSSETENRKMKSWITGSVGGAYTTDVDEMRMHYLTERCLITQGANNFFLFQD